MSLLWQTRTQETNCYKRKKDEATRENDQANMTTNGNNGQEDVVLMALTNGFCGDCEKWTSHKKELCHEHNEFCLMITDDEQEDKKPSATKKEELNDNTNEVEPDEIMEVEEEGPVTLDD